MHIIMVRAAVLELIMYYPTHATYIHTRSNARPDAPVVPEWPPTPRPCTMKYIAFAMSASSSSSSSRQAFAGRNVHPGRHAAAAAWCGKTARYGIIMRTTAASVINAIDSSGSGEMVTCTLEHVPDAHFLLGTIGMCMCAGIIIFILENKRIYICSASVLLGTTQFRFYYYIYRILLRCA